MQNLYYYIIQVSIGVINNLYILISYFLLMSWESFTYKIIKIKIGV